MTPRFSALLLLPVLLALGGCGSSNSTPSPTATLRPLALAHYSDPHLGFSFDYPRTWSVAKKPGYQNIGGVQTYVLDVNLPNNVAHLTVTVDGQVIAFPPFQNGHIGHIPGDPHTFRYFHVNVDGWHSMYIQRLTGGAVSEVDTITNTQHRSYDVKMLTANPPFPSDVLAQYEAVVKSVKVPFS